MAEKKKRKVLRAKSKLEAILDGIEEGIVIIDKDYKILSANKAFIKNLRYAGENVIGKHCYKVIHNYPGPCRQCVARNTFKTGEFYESIHSHIEKEGNRIYHETKSYPLRDSDGKVKKVIYIFRDITKKKEVEEQIKWLKEHKENIVASIPFSILAINEDLKIISANRSFYKDFKLKKEEVEDKSIDEVLPPVLSKKILRAIQEESFFKNREIEHIFPKMGKKILNVSLVRMGAKEEILIIMEDISERKKLEEELIISGKLAALGGLAAGLAHEINNPLAIISGYVQLLLQSGLITKEDKKKQYLKEILEQTERVARIVGRIRDFARTSGPKMEPTDINKTFIKTLLLVREEVHLKNIKIEENFDFSLPQTKADKGQLEEIFLSIILNAVQAMPDGGNLSVITRLRNQGLKAGLKKAIEVRIVDTGCGIPKKNLGRIFNPFFSTKRGSTGLGLSIAHTLIEKHNGTINVESEENKGTNVVIIFPLTPDKQRDE